MVKNKLHHCECSECARRGEELAYLEKMFELLEVATSGFVCGSAPDLEWRNAKDKLFEDYRRGR